MSTIFISHSSDDNATAAEMRERLRAQEYHSVFLDFDPKDGIPAGRDWENELYHKLKVCRAVIFLCSPASMASKWCFAEVTQAKAMGKDIFPVKVNICQIDLLLTKRQTVDLTVDKEEGYDRLWQGLKLAVGEDFPFNPAQPYPGFDAFQESDAGVFFGREEEIIAVLDRLMQMRHRGEPSLVLVLGASGCGKSSLVRAGVLPRLKRDPSRWLIVPPFRPSNRPLEELAKALAQSFSNSRSWKQILDHLSPALVINPTTPQTLLPLNDLVDDLKMERGQREATAVLVIDQFEELFDPQVREATTAFLKVLRPSLQSKDSSMLVLATLRSDFLGEFQTHLSLRNLRFENIPLGPMPENHLPLIIEGPASRIGIDIEPGLVARIINDTSNQDALPLLAFTLREMWNREKQKFTVKTYEKELNGIQGAVARVAQDIVGTDRLTADQEKALRQAFLKMVRVNEEGQFARRQVGWEELPEIAKPILERFVKSRLLISRTENGERVVEVVHEALFRVWKDLAKWLENNRPFLSWRNRLQKKTQEFDPKDNDTFLRGAFLDEAVRWSNERNDELDEGEIDFINKSVKIREEAKQRQELWRKRVLLSVSAAAIAFLLLTSWAGFQWWQTVKQREILRSQKLASQANFFLASQKLDLALLVGVEANQNKTMEAERALLTTIQRSYPLV